MFNCFKPFSTGIAKKTNLPVAISEEERLPEEWNQYAPSYSPRKKRKVTVGVDDASLLVELTWAARDVTVPECPRTRKEIRRRLGFTRKKKSNEHEARFLQVDGIGEMYLSDESPGAELSSDSSSSESDIQNLEELNSIAVSEGVVETMMPFSKTKKTLKKVESKIKTKPSYKAVKQLKKRVDLNVPVARRPLVAAIKSPYIFANHILHHLIQQTLASHHFRDAVQLMSLFLLEAFRPMPHDIPVQNIRLFSKFCTSIPEFCYSDVHIELLQRSYGYPIILRDDIVIRLTTIRLARCQFDEILEFLQGLIQSTQRVYGSGQLRCLGNVRLCYALATVAQWLYRREPDEQKRQSGKTARFAALLGQKREVDEAKREVDSGISAFYRAKMVPPTILMRLIVLLFLDTDIDKVLSILQDFHSVAPYLLDVLELKVLLLQKRSQEEDTPDFLASLIHGKNNLDVLIETTLEYIDAARGEPQSLTLAIQAFHSFPLMDRLRCLFLFLKSNMTFGPAWRLVIDETLRVLGRERHSKKRRSVGVQHIWQLIDEILGPLDKLNLYRKLFDASRTSLLMFLPGDRIFVFLAAPFFVSNWHSFVTLGRLISNGFPNRPSLIRLRSRQCQKRFLPSTIPVPSLPTKEAIRGLQDLVEFVYPQIDSNDSVINTTELYLLTEVAYQLSPPLTIENTTRLASVRWKQKLKK